MEAADDRAIWEFAESDGYTVVSQDADFAEKAILLGGPPKGIWIRAGNLPWLEVASLLRRYAELIADLDGDEAVCLEICQQPGQSWRARTIARQRACYGSLS